MNGWRVGAGWAAMAVLVLVVMACGDAVAPHVPPTNLFLPAGTAVTPDGDPIFRSEGGLSEVRSARAGARPTGVGSLTNWGVRWVFGMVGQVVPLKWIY